MTRQQLVATMSGQEFAYWMALFRIELAEQQKARRDSAGKARARQMVSRMRSVQTEGL